MLGEANRYPDDHEEALARAIAQAHGIPRERHAGVLDGPLGELAAVQPGTGRIHINDVGENTWEEIDLGALAASQASPGPSGSIDPLDQWCNSYAFLSKTIAEAGTSPEATDTALRAQLAETWRRVR